MPTISTTAALRAARASAPAGVDIIQTLQLSHPLWPADYFLTNFPRSFDATLDTGAAVTFQPFPFTLTLPTVDGAGQQNLQVTLTNADQAIADAVQVAHGDPTTNIVAVYREYLSTAAGAPQSPPLRLSFASIQITEEAVAGVAGRTDVLNRRFPGVWYDVQHFPGLDR